ncbi:hypothetical protein Ancab_028503, partial [Ancistrocladus abbreviatus]
EPENGVSKKGCSITVCPSAPEAAMAGSCASCRKVGLVRPSDAEFFWGFYAWRAAAEKDSFSLAGES